MTAMKENDDFGNRMKSYEAVETKRVLRADLPIYARIDGRAFSSFTRGMKRPYDADLATAMVATAADLCRKTNARIAYTQFDEINLVWLGAKGETQPLFGGKVHKLTSVLASMAAAKFARHCPTGYEDRLPHFDCRVLQLPNNDEAANMILWRAMDARKNAISSLAQSMFSHRALHGMGQARMIEMIEAKGSRLDAMPMHFQRGTFLRNETVMRVLTAAEMKAIPEHHRPTGPVMRSEIALLDMPPFNTVQNRVKVIFDKAEPVLREDPRTYDYPDAMWTL